MKCKICGAELKKEGDICKECYKKYQEEEELKNDKNVRLKIKSAYKVEFEVKKYAEFDFFMILMIILFAFSKQFLSALLVFVAFVVIELVLFFIDKKFAIGTTVTLYDKKMVYRRNVFFIHRVKTVKYSDLSDVSYYQTRRQKKLGMGDLCVYAKGKIPGKTLLNGFQIKNVSDVANVLQKIGEIVILPEENKK